MSALYLPVEVLWGRIVARIEKTESGCWVWPGATVSTGYGCIGSGKRSKSVLTHHVAAMASGREIPDGMTVDHMCHDSYECRGGRSCEHRRCVNPDHLDVVTREANASRQWDRTTCRKGHELTTRRDGVRRCKTCAGDYRTRKRDERREAARLLLADTA